MQGGLLTRNAILNLLGQAIPLAVAVVAMPLVIHGLGPERYGILAMAWVVLGYFGMFDLGLGRAATRFVASALGSGTVEKVPLIAWTAVLVQTGLGLLGAAILAGVTPLLVGEILNIPAGLLNEARSSFYVIALSLPVVLVSGSLRGVLEAAQRFDLVNAAAVPLSVGNYLLPLIGVVLGWRLPAIVGLLVGSRALGLIAFYLLCVHVFPSLRRLPRFHATEAGVLLRFGGWVTVSSVVSPILVYLDRFMIGALLTIAAVAYYAAPYEMVTRLLIVPASVAATLFPAFSSLEGERGRDAQAPARLVAASTKYLLLALGPAVVILLGFSGDLLHVWLGAEFARRSAAALQILAVGVLANSLAQVPFALIQGLARPDVTAKIHLAELPLQGILVWALVRWWGITGGALAWSLRATVDAFLLFIFAARLTGTSWRSLIDRQATQLLGLLVVLGGLATGASVLVHDPALRVVALAVPLLGAALVTWRHLLDDGDRARIARMARLSAAPATPRGRVARPARVTSRHSAGASELAARHRP